MTTFGDRLYQLGGIPVGGYEGDGAVFYVDPSSGSASNSGTKPTDALASMQDAIDLCVADRGDTIIRMPGSEVTTAVINVNKAGITIKAATYGIATNQPEKFSTYPGASYTSGPTMIVSQPCAIYGIEVVGRNTTSAYTDTGVDSGAAIVLIGEGGGYLGGFCHIANCRFVDWWGNDYGIELAAGAYNLIENCVFEGYAAGVYMRSTASNNPQSNTVKNCRFETCVNGIEHRAGSAPHDFLYQGCKFIAISGVDIDTTGGLGDGMIAECNLWNDATGYTDLANEAAVRAAGIASVGNNFNG
jgi:parallel beta-helix repeat protein